MKKKSLSAKKTIHKLLFKHLDNNRINKIFKSFKDSLKNENNIKNRIGIAISGGPDSLALAYFAKCYSLIKKLDARFFIVDHKLRKESSIEAKSVKLFLEKFDINCNILKWVGKKPKTNIQGVARNNRYNLLKKACLNHNISHLLIGHHADDLYENFFIRLLRGSGLRGLSSFGEVIEDEQQNISILRPLIKINKKDLIYVSKKVFQFFINDPSNQNFDFQRIRIRKFISNLNKEGLNKKKLKLTIRNLKSANNALNFYTKKNISENAKFIKKTNIYILNELFFFQSEEVIFRSISLVLQKISGRYYSPRGKSILDLIFKIRSDKYKKFTLGGCFIEKVNKTTLITKEN